MKTPDEIKKGLECCSISHDYCGTECPYNCYANGSAKLILLKDSLAYIQQLEDAIDKTTQLMQSATEVIKKSQEQLESTYSQVKKSLCGKENVSWVEVLEAADQLKSRLAQAERERETAVHDCSRFPCATCSDKENGDLCHNCNAHKDTTRTNYEWRGVCPKNTKEE